MQTAEHLPSALSAAGPSSSSASISKKATAAPGKTTVDGTTGELGTAIDEAGGASHVSSERAFADYVLGSLILHGFCVNFIN